MYQWITLYFLYLSGCDCDDTLPNADEFCPNNYKCKQCQCLPAGNWLMTFVLPSWHSSCSDCECDDQSPNADQFCAVGEQCKNCKCLPKGE